MYGVWYGVLCMDWIDEGSRTLSVLVKKKKSAEPAPRRVLLQVRVGGWNSLHLAPIHKGK